MPEYLTCKFMSRHPLLNSRHRHTYIHVSHINCALFLSLLYVEYNAITPWLLVRERTIPTERQPIVGELSANYCVVSEADTLRL
jgi:hypothetical protein